MEEKQVKDGKVMITEEIGFTIDGRCYPMFKVKEVKGEDGSVTKKEVQLGKYPTTIEGVLGIVAKDMMIERTSGLTMSLAQLHKVLVEIKAEIKDIGNKLSL